MSRERSSGSIVADSKFQFGSTFLSEYWQSKETLELETRKAYLLNLLKRSISTLVTVPATALASVVSVTGALIVLSLFLFFDTNLRRLLDQVGSENQGIIYFSDNASDQEVADVQGILKSFNGVENRYISKEEALGIFTKDLGARKDLLNGLEGNPLPKSVEFTVSGAGVDKSIEEIKNALGTEGSIKKSGVEEIVFGAPWAQSAEKLRVGVLQVSLSVLMIVVLVVVFLVSNVIKLMLFSQKEEIEIMQLVGSSSSRISAPYLLSGGILGVMGAFLALMLSFLIFVVFLKPLNSYLLFGVSYQVFQFLSLGNVFFILISGLGLGICGSFLAIKKWLVK
jgi:cell division transport system permease protein